VNRVSTHRCTVELIGFDSHSRFGLAGLLMFLKGATIMMIAWRVAGGGWSEVCQLATMYRCPLPSMTCFTSSS